MRIKINDKIYRLKEIESGVDSLMELAEEPKHKYKEGDFLTTVGGRCFILKNICGSKVYDHAFLGENGLDWDNGHCCYLDDITGYCTPEERSKVIAAIKKDGKRWNTEKKRIEDIPEYKHGDFLMTKKKIAFILDREGKCGEAHHLFCVDMDQQIDSNLQKCGTGEKYCGYLKNAVLADDKAAEAIIKGLKKLGKYWDGNRKCIEDIPVYKDGDFLRTKLGNLFILKEIKRISYNKEPSAFCHFFTSVSSDYKGYGLNKNGVCFEKEIEGYCTPKERQRILDDLAKDGKCWNTEKLCIENMQVRKFKVGDKVRIKQGVSSKTHLNAKPCFVSSMDELIGRVLTVIEYGYCNVYVEFNENEEGFVFNEDWLEPYTDDTPKRKFKAGDVVRIKDGVSSDTHRRVSPNFTESMDKFIGKELTVKKYNDFGWVEFYEDGSEYQFHEDWLEPWSDEPKVGDWVIFWDYSPKLAKVGILTGINSDSLYTYRIDEGVHWMYAVKWDGTKEHLEEVRKDKI